MASIAKVSQTVFLPNYIGNVQSWAVDMAQQTAEILNLHAYSINQLIAGSGLSIIIGTTPISGGTSGQYLYNNAGIVGTQALPTATSSVFGISRPDNSTITISSGVLTAHTTPTAPGGSSSNVQYNSSSAFAGDPDFTTDGAGNISLLTLKIKNGAPWADVTAWGAVGNNSTNCTTAIQNAINYMNTTYGGGYIIFPPGVYVVSSTITVKGGCILVGSEQGTTLINGSGQDATVLAYDSSTNFGGLQDISVEGYIAVTSPTNHCVTIANGVVVNMRNVKIIGGNYGLANGGVDGRFYNGFIMGRVGGIYSTGANFYTDCKIDNPGFSPGPTIGFYRAAYYTTGTAEDQIVDSDFSGANFTNSFHIDDGGALQVRTKIIGSVLSAALNVVNHNWTLVMGCEVAGSWTLTSTNPVTVIGCYQQGGSVSLPGANVIKSGNYNIT